MSNTTLTNIPNNLDIKIKEPSDGAQVPPSGPWSSDRFSTIYFLVLPISLIFNCSLATSSVLNQWKVLYVIPLHKKGSK